MSISLTSQISEVERELALRRSVYPAQVGKGTLKQSVADLLTERMEAVLKTLRWVEKNELELRAFLAAKRVAP
jgi:hypothetical protein